MCNELVKLKLDKNKLITFIGGYLMFADKDNSAMQLFNVLLNTIDFEIENHKYNCAICFRAD